MTRVYAHRGDSAAHPENTLLAFRKAIESGAFGVELDLHATSDGTVVVIHDRSLERTTNGRGFVDELPLEAVRQLDAGAGERVDVDLLLTVFFAPAFVLAGGCSNQALASRRTSASTACTARR